MIVPGLLMLPLAYAVAYFSQPGSDEFPLTGRDTRFSLAAVLASSITVAGLAGFLITAFRNSVWRAAMQIAAGLTFCTLFLYSFVIQRDYITEWRHHRQMLTQVIQLTPDVQKGGVIVIGRKWIGQLTFPTGPRRPSIGFQPHGLQVSMERLFENGHGPPIMVVFTPDWKRFLRVGDDGKLYWSQNSFPGGGVTDIAPPLSQLIVLNERDDGNLERPQETLFVDGRQVIAIPPPGAVESNWVHFPRSRLLPLVLPDFPN
jgi:hypothetical protein